MNKFQSNITKGSGILADRAKLVSNQAKLEQENLLRGLEGQKNKLELQLYQLADVSFDDSISLKFFGKAASDSAGWVKEMHELKKQIALLEIEIKIAEATKTEWFSEEEVLSKAKSELKEGV